MDEYEGAGGMTSLLRRSRIKDLRAVLMKIEPLKMVLVPTEIGDGAAQIAAMRAEIARLEAISDDDYELELARG